MLRQMFPNFDPGNMIRNMNRAGAPYGITFNPFEVVANTRLALEASEFARDAGLFEQAHTRIFKAYFQEGKNIGDLETLLDLLGEIGLDRQLLSSALENRTYASRLQQVRERARKHDVTALPTFIIGGKDKLVGARPYDNFTRLLR